MSYQALYRKFRPQNFEEVRGQDAVVKSLKNQVMLGKTSHAYLFTGTRGTGKTSVAKILARAVNCENPQDGSPCNECPTCKRILAGASLNVIEIDAASNNGVDNIRQIKEEVQYRPTEGKYKVYIIDEAHMLTPSAYNALLKTIEEPPEYVMFILATTDVQKIAITIMSRCQRYDFRRIELATIAKQLRNLAKQEQISIEDSAVNYLAKAADGSMRDALSLMDRCIALYLGEDLTYDHVLQALGAVDNEIFEKLVRALTDCRMTDCLRVVEEVVMQGRELAQFVSDFCWYLRNLLLIQNSDDLEDFINASREKIEEMKEVAKIISPVELMRDIRILSELGNQMKFATDKRVLLEVALIKMASPSMSHDLTALAARINQLERLLAGGYVPGISREDLPAEPLKVKEEESKVIKKFVKRDALPEDIRTIVEHWGELCLKLTQPLKHSMIYAKPAFTENKLELIFHEVFVYRVVCQHLEDLKEEIYNEFEVDADIRVRLIDVNEPQEVDFIDMEEVIGMNIEEEDF